MTLTRQLSILAVVLPGALYATYQVAYHGYLATTGSPTIVIVQVPQTVRVHRLTDRGCQCTIDLHRVAAEGFMVWSGVASAAGVRGRMSLRGDGWIVQIYDQSHDPWRIHCRGAWVFRLDQALAFWGVYVGGIDGDERLTTFATDQPPPVDGNVHNSLHYGSTATRANRSRR